MTFKLLTLGALAAALALPLAASAQQSQPPPTQQAQGRTTPSEAKVQHRWMKRLGGLNLSADQQQHIQSLIGQFSQAHPEGSPRDPNAARALREQILSVLTPDQQSQYRQMVAQRRAQQAQRRGQAGQQYQGQYQQPADGQSPDGQPGNGQPGNGQPYNGGPPPNDQQPNEQPQGPPPV